MFRLWDRSVGGGRRTLWLLALQKFECECLYGKSFIGGDWIEGKLRESDHIPTDLRDFSVWSARVVGKGHQF